MTRHTPELEAISDDIDRVNSIKGTLHDGPSTFDAEKDKAKFRQYETACDRVKNFYKEQHGKFWSNFDYDRRCLVSLAMQSDRLWNSISMHELILGDPLEQEWEGIWQAMEKLNTLVDESDPDTELSQMEHLLQTAEAIRRDGKPEWMQVVGLVHDLGKLLYIFGS
ncbi:hypothetical protein C0991_010686, partial [Blastosporella zonata]